MAEASPKHEDWTIFGRAERIHYRELLGLDGPAYWVGKVSFGAVRDTSIADPLKIGADGLFAVNFAPTALAPSYGGKNPIRLMGLVRLKLD